MKPQFKGCLKESMDAIKPCFSVDEQKNLKIINNVTEQLAEFVCYKDGDRIACKYYVPVASDSSVVKLMSRPRFLYSIRG